MSVTVRIRPLTAEDLPAVLGIERVAYSTPWPEASFQGLLGRPDTALFVAEVQTAEGDGTATDGQGDDRPGDGPGGDHHPTIAGYAISWAVREQGELGNIAVAPAWRNQGVARRLLEEVIAAMRERGVRELFLEVRLSNAVAQHLYRKFGFREVGVRRAYYSSPTEDALVMRLEIQESHPAAPGPGTQ